MKKSITALRALLMSLAMVAVSSGLLIAQTTGEYRSNAPTPTGGNWSNAGTWQTWNGSSWVGASTAPTGSEPKITIQSTDSVYVDAAVTITDTIYNQGKLGGGSNLTFGNGGVYQHAQNGGSIPTATWNTGSSCLITGVTGNAPSNANQNYYNFTWNCPSQSSSVNIGWQTGVTIAGTLTCTSTNWNHSSTSSPSYQLRLFGAAGSCTINNIVVNGNKAVLTMMGSGYNDTVAVSGNITLSNGCMLSLSNNSSGIGTYYLNGDLIVLDSTYIGKSNSGNLSKFVFKKAGTQNFSHTTPGLITYFGAPNFLVNSGSTLNLDTVAVGGAGSFTVASGATLAVGHPSGLNGNIACSGANGGGNSFSTSANYTFNGTSAQVTGSLMPLSVNNLTINNPASVNLSNTVTVNGVLTLNSGNFTLGIDTLTAMSVSGGSASSYVVTDTIGVLKIMNVGTGSSATFPIGTSSSYNPVTVSNTVAADNFSARVMSTFSNQPIDPTKVVNREWTISEDASSGGSVVGLTFQWSSTDQGTAFNPAAAVSIGRYAGTVWSEKSATVSGTGPYSAMASGFSNLSNSAFAVGNQGALAVPTIITSNGTGGGTWDSTSTWVGGVIPDSTSNVAIAGGDSVYVNNAPATDGCNDLTIKTNARLNVKTAFTVKGAFAIQSDGWFYNSNSSLLSFPKATSYSIDTASYYVHTSAASGSFGSAGYDSTFGNVIIMKSGTLAGANLSINGNLIVETGGSGNNFKGTAAVSLTHHVHGNVQVISGQWSCVDASSGSSNNAVCIWNVDGNVTVGDSSTSSGLARMGTLNSANTVDSRTGIFNIGGNLSFVNGAKLQAGSSIGSSSTTETGIINLKGNLSFDNTTALATNSKGKFAINFVGNGEQTVTLGKPFLLSSSSNPVTLYDTVASAAKVVFNSGSSWASTSAGGANGGGAFVVNGTLMMGAGDTLSGLQAFVLNSGATLGIAHPSGVNGNIQLTGTQTYNPGANFVFDGTAAQVTGSIMPAAANMVTISNSHGVSLSNNLVLSDSLAFTAGLLHLAADTLTTSGVMGAQPTNYVVTDGAGVLKIDGVGTTQAFFPVGTSVDFAPVWITNSGTPDAFSVSASPDTSLVSQGVDRVTVKWKIAEGTSGGSNCTLKFGWMSTEESSAFANNRSANAKIYFLADSGNTEAGTGSYATQLTNQPYTVSRGGISTFGSFGVGSFTITSVNETESVPIEFKLYPNYPNPFNPSTKIEFTVVKKGMTSLKIYNILGQEVATLFSADAQPGKKYSAEFNAGSLSSGVYFSVLQSSGQRQIQKMVLMK